MCFLRRPPRHQLGNTKVSLMHANANSKSIFPLNGCTRLPLL